MVRFVKETVFFEALDVSALCEICSRPGWVNNLVSYGNWLYYHYKMELDVIQILCTKLSFNHHLKGTCNYTLCTLVYEQSLFLFRDSRAQRPRERA